MLRHFFAELECAILGHDDDRRYETKVYKKYRGKCEKVADNCCANCGHFIVNGLSRVRKKKEN
jgi:hypothetical protein